MKLYEMNEYQKAIFDIELMYPDTAVCNLGGVIRFKEKVDPYRLKDAMETLIKNTPAIRLQITEEGKLYVSDNIVELEISEFCEDYTDLAEKFVSEPFKLYNFPLYSIHYMPHPDGGVGIFKMHHILGDYIAILSFFGQLEKVYNGAEYQEDTRYLDNMTNLPQGEWTEHFKSRFSNIKQEVLFPRPKSICANVARRDIDADMAGTILDYCHNNKIKPESVFYAALAVYMKKTRDTDTSIFGYTVMNRGRGTLNVFGLYANTILIFVRGEGDFLSVCQNAQNEANAAGMYAAYPLNRILADNGIRERCFDVAVSYISMGMMPRIGLGEMERYYNGYSEIPIRIHILRHKKSISLQVEYISELFTERYINGFISSLLNIIKQGINNLEMRAASDEDILAYKALNNVKKFAADMTVSQAFEAYALSHENDTAYIYDGEAVSYKTALIIAKNTAKIISGKKVAAIACGRCRYLIPAMIGVMSAGAAYMPVNPELEIPQVCDAVLSLKKYGIENAINLDEIEYNETDFADCSVTKGAAYYMQTSGSTGEPKTVIISNESLYIRLKWMHDKYGLDKKILQKTSLTFDVSGWELLSCALGGEVVLIKDGEERAPETLIEYIKNYNIETIHFVPSMLRMFAESVERDDSLPLRDIFSSGETLDAAVMRLVSCKLPNVRLHNLYGPTECTIDVSYYDCTGTEDNIPIGRPVYNTGLYIMNSAEELMPRGVTGELIITGDLVGKGYLGGGGGYTSINGQRAYKTGDRCYLGFDGNIYYVGRNDSQVKINGKRVDLNRLKSMADDISGVNGSAAVYDGKHVYLFCRTERDASEIRLELAKKTDRLPSRIFCVDILPVTSSGKLDRAALVRAAEERRKDYEPPESRREKDIYKAVMEELNRYGVVYRRIDVNEDIFDLGIDSLSALSLIQELKKSGYDFTAQDLYSGRTIRAIAANTAKTGIVKLKDGNSGSVICCFPYAGGIPQAFFRFTRGFDGDAFGVDYARFNAADTTEIAEATANVMKEYDHIILASACIGSACALETAYILEQEGRTVDGIYIIGNLPVKNPRGINPWRMLPRKTAARLVSKLGGREMPGAFPIEQFLSDTDRYFKYMRYTKRRLKARGHIAFAKGDAFTAGYARKKNKWNAYFENPPVISEFDTDDHYFFEDADGVMEDMK